MPNNTNTSYLNYSFDKRLKDDYQTVFVGHFFGTTFAIHANFQPTFDADGNVIELLGDFFSQHMGGHIYFALRDVGKEITTEISIPEETTHILDVKLNAFTKSDSDFDPVVLKFKQPYKINNDILRIQIKNDDIVNLTEGMIEGSHELINDDRSCNNILGGGNG